MKNKDGMVGRLYLLTVDSIGLLRKLRAKNPETGTRMLPQ